MPKPEINRWESSNINNQSTKGIIYLNALALSNFPNELKQLALFSSLFLVLCASSKRFPRQTVSPYSFFLQDPRGNRIFQWQNVTSEMNIIQIEFPLTEEPVLGNYKIIVAKKSGVKTNHSFLVEEYGKCYPLILFRVENTIRNEPLSINPFDC